MKYMDKLKRDRRVLNYEQKILKCFYPNQFKVDNYEKGNEDYNCWHKKFIKEKLKDHYEYLRLQKKTIQTQHFLLILFLYFLNVYMYLNLIVERNQS
jgi:hypothetical protein